MATTAQSVGAAAVGVLFAGALLIASVLWWRGIVRYNRWVFTCVLRSSRVPPRRSERLTQIGGAAVLALCGLAVAVSVVVRLVTA